MPDPNEIDAIHTDVPVEGENQTRPKTKRELDMEALEESHLRRFEQESGVKLIEDKPSTAKQGEVDGQLAAQLSDGADVIADTAGKMVKVKVDGVEQDVSLDEVLRSYQKGNAADRRLEEATKLLKEAKEQVQQRPAPQPQQEPAVTPPAAAGPDDLDAAVKTALSHLFAGDDETAAKELSAVIARSARGATPQAPALDVNQIAEQLQQRMSVQSALDTIKTDYPALVEDPDLEALTLFKVQTKEAGGTPRAQALLDAAAEVYKTIGKQSGRQNPDPTPAPQTSREQKLARKAALDSLPAASASAAQHQVEEDASPSAVIAAMAAKRLGQSMPS